MSSSTFWSNTKNKLENMNKMVSKWVCEKQKYQLVYENGFVGKMEGRGL